MRLGNERLICPYFEYVEGINIQIGYINDEDSNRMLKKSTSVTFDRKHQKDEDIDYLKFNRMMIRKAIVGWKPFKRRKLIFLIQPDKAIVLDPGETMDDEISFSEEMRDFIVENTHIGFMNWVMSAAREVELFARAAEKEELENLPRSSGGK